MTFIIVLFNIIYIMRIKLYCKQKLRHNKITDLCTSNKYFPSKTKTAFAQPYHLILFVLLTFIFDVWDFCKDEI